MLFFFHRNKTHKGEGGEKTQQLCAGNWLTSAVAVSCQCWRITSAASAAERCSLHFTSAFANGRSRSLCLPRLSAGCLLQWPGPAHRWKASIFCPLPHPKMETGFFFPLPTLSGRDREEQTLLSDSHTHRIPHIFCCAGHRPGPAQRNCILPIRSETGRNAQAGFKSLFWVSLDLKPTGLPILVPLGQHGNP